jgi:hypothetical protein
LIPSSSFIPSSKIRIDLLYHLLLQCLLDEERLQAASHKSELAITQFPGQQTNTQECFKGACYSWPINFRILS